MAWLRKPGSRVLHIYDKYVPRGPRPDAPPGSGATPGDWRAIDAAINARSGGSCEIEHPGCTGRWTERHHRLMRSQGGADTPENVLGLCNAGHLFVHSQPVLSYERGWLLHSWEEA